MASFKLSPSIAPWGLMIGCIIFGLGSMIVAYVPIGAYAIAFWRLAVAALIFAILMRWVRQTLPKRSATKCYALLSGGFLAMDLALWHESIYAVGPGISTLLNGLQIFWLSGIGVVWFRERLSYGQIFSLIMAIAGVALIASPEWGQNHQALWGMVSGLLSGLMLACSMVFVRKTHQAERTSIFPLMLLISIGGLMTLILPMLWFNWGKILPQTWAHVGWVVVYGAVMQCLAWGLIAYSIPLLSLNLTGLLLLSEPVAALWIDYAFLGKPINMIQWIGAGMTLCAIYLGSLKKS